MIRTRSEVFIYTTLVDWITVIYEVGLVQRDDATPEKLGLLMAGVKEGA